ncbi:hypothetical protein [Paraburkholderia sp.]|uniref:hypothetical protein n=1 Tax=Paraburkholderia sp. TaxID=1926495 RepID=UPI0039E41565
MIIRYALFEGQVYPDQMAAFQRAVIEEVLPLWKKFPHANAVRVSFARSRDPGAQEFPMILAVTYPNLEAVDMALGSPVRIEARAATEKVLSRFFTGKVHHHVMDAEEQEL